MTRNTFTINIGLILLLLTIYKHRDTEITDRNDPLIEKCFNISKDQLDPGEILPLPVRLYSNDDNVSYVCGSRKNLDYYFSFTCDIYGESLIWFFDGMVVKSYQNYESDEIDRREEVPIHPDQDRYQLHSVLLSVVNDSFRGNPMCNGTLTVRPYSLTGLTPFTVTCQTYCPNLSFSATNAICHHQQYQVLGKFRSDALQPVVQVLLRFYHTVQAAVLFML